MAILLCPKCRGKISPNAKKCTHCGAKLKTCSECEAVLLKQTEICWNCGYNFEKETTATENNLSEVDVTCEDDDCESNKNKKHKKNKKDSDKTHAINCKINRLYNSWQDMDKYMNYEENITLLKVFSIIQIVLVIVSIVFLVAFLFFFGIPDDISALVPFLVLCITFIVLDELFSIPEEIYHCFIFNFSRNSLIEHSKTKKISLKDSILEFQVLYNKNKNITPETCWGTTFIIDTQYYLEHQKLLKIENFINIFRLILKIIAKISIFPLLLIKNNNIIIGLLSNDFTFKSLIFAFIPVIIVIICLKLLSIRFKIARKSKVIKWLNTEIPEMVEFYRDDENYYLTKR